jgi:threonine dehydratase
LIEHGDDFYTADRYADELARKRRLFRMPSFDLLLVRGVASYALEFLRRTPALDAVFVPIGWGSGAIGLAAARNALGLKTTIIGVVSASAPACALSFAAGRAVEQKSSTRIITKQAPLRLEEES